MGIIFQDYDAGCTPHMSKLHYISVVRFPTEKAHGLQIAQNCEALASIGYEVELWVSSRKNTPEMSAIENIYDYYGINQNFTIRRIPSIDLYHLADNNPRLEYFAFFVHIITYCIMLMVNGLGKKADVYYSREEYPLLALSMIIPKEKLVFEAHQFALSRRRASLQKWLSQRVGHIITITSQLRDDYIEHYGITPQHVLVAHDGIREARFRDLPEKNAAREMVSWSQDAFIVGFVGRLQMLTNLDKGVGILIDAIAQLEGVTLALVGGPDKSVNQLKEKWQAHGLPSECFLYAGHVSPTSVPIYLRAFDICAMSHPFNPQFAYYTSPLKLFEYMASERPIIASDLPGWSVVVADEETALLFPPEDVVALANAIERLKNDADLRERLAKAARQRVMQSYTWEARARMIRNHLERGN